MSLLPDLETPRITRVRGSLQGRAADQLDAVLAIVRESATAKSLARLPGAKRWQELHARRKSRAGSVRSTALANSRQTLAVLGYLKADATPFECLALAGRMLKEAGSRCPRTIALLSDEGVVALEALLAAALAHAFALPSFHSKPHRRASHRAHRRVRR